MAGPIPPLRGPKLHPFNGDISDIEFIRVLNVGDTDSSGYVPHSRVFEVVLGNQRLALKVFNFFSIDEIQPFVPGHEHLLTEDLVRYQLDPFYAECRAFGQLVGEQKDHLFAVRCYGYIFLPPAIELRITQQFGISDWNREAADEGRPLRAILKDYIRFKTPFGRKKFPEMRDTLKKLNDMGIYNMDIREANYLGGRLFDFSIAITVPHISFWEKLRPTSQILEDMDYDLNAFDAIAKRVTAERNDLRVAAVKRLRSSGRKDTQ